MKISNKIIFIIILIVLINFINSKPVFADVGDFQTYLDTEFEWSVDGFDFGSDIGAEEGAAETALSLNGVMAADMLIVGLLYFILWVIFLGSDPNVDTLTFTIRVLIIFGIIFILKVIVDFIIRQVRMHRKTTAPPKPIENIEVDEYAIDAEIEKTEPGFSRVDMLRWAGDLFENLQEAWTKRDWKVIRFYEADELYNLHSRQLKEYIKNKQVNVIENVVINWIKFYNFKQEAGKDFLTIVLNSSMIDYIIDEDTKEVLNGDKATKRKCAYKMTFVRKTGVKTKPGVVKVNTTNCPNCGATTEIGETGQCPYCKTIVTTGEFSWVLLNLEPFNEK